MARTRYIKDSMWSDSRYSDLDPIEKTLWMHLLTNDRVGICGIYEIPIKKIAMETGIDREMVPKLLVRFENDGKCFYRDGWIIIKNFFKNLGITKEEDNLWKGIQREIETIPSNTLKKLRSDKVIYQNMIDTYGGLQGAYKVLGKLYLTLLNLTLLNSTLPNGEISENFDFSPEHDFDETETSIPPTPLSPKRSIINKNNKPDAIAVYDVIKKHAGLVDGSLDDCVVLASKLKKLGADPGNILDEIVVAMIHTGQDQFYSIANPRKLHDNLGTIYNKIKANISKQQSKVFVL